MKPLFRIPPFHGRVGGADKNRHVIVVSLDGFATHTLRDSGVPFPVLRKMMAEGASAEAMIPGESHGYVAESHRHHLGSERRDPRRHLQRPSGPSRRRKALKVEPWVPKTELVQTRTVV